MAKTHTVVPEAEVGLQAEFNPEKSQRNNSGFGCYL